jgi:histidinol-phosphate phosphatase family protein
MAFPENIDQSWSLFLDRDGVINQRIPGGYALRPDDFVFLPGVPESIALLGSLFGKVVVVTNQQGIGKGLMTEKQLQAVHEKMMDGIRQAGGRIDAVFFCPDLSSKPDNCRKPSPFLALEAQKRFPEIDFAKSIMVGDTESDMRFGRNAGMVTALIGDEPVFPQWVDGHFADLPAFAKYIQKIIQSS